jgi:hypothetical protein
VFHSIVTSSIEQMEAYSKMVADVSKSLNQFRDENTTDDARTRPADRAVSPTCSTWASTSSPARASPSCRLRGRCRHRTPRSPGCRSTSRAGPRGWLGMSTTIERVSVADPVAEAKADQGRTAAHIATDVRQRYVLLRDEGHASASTGSVGPLKRQDPGQDHGNAFNASSQRSSRARGQGQAAATNARKGGPPGTARSTCMSQCDRRVRHRQPSTPAITSAASDG